MAAKAIPSSEIFSKSTKLKPSGRIITLSGSLPGERASKGDRLGAVVTAKDSAHSKQIRLEKKLAEGGEGAVFTTSLNGYVAKIYKRDKLTTDRRDKLTAMISKQISCEGICFPEALILNERDEFIGYLLRQADGFELGKSVFQPKLLQQKFPKWTRRETVDMSLSILQKIKYLNDRNVILGDINPANILVTSAGKVFFVDCDSYQVEGFPCPVGTANFTPPEAQGRDYKTFLRSQEMENFAIATLLFMIMLPGKPPYSAVGGASPEHNIKEGVFPYPHKETETDKTPPGKWGYIWSHMSYKMRLAFYENFKKGEKHFMPAQRYSADEWIEEFKAYRYALDKMVQNDPMAVDIFPTREKMKKCKDCGKQYVPNRDNYTPFCPECDAKHNKYRSRPVNPSSGYGSTSSVGSRPATNTGKKLCPYCHTEHIPLHWKYCNSCKNKVVKQRECVNCHKIFPVTASLDAWEKEHSATRKQCDICKAAGCTADPCRHALQAASTAPGQKSSATQSSSSKISGYQKTGATSSSSARSVNKAQDNSTQKEHGVGCGTILAALFTFYGIAGEWYWLTDVGQFDMFDFVWILIGIGITAICYWFKK